MMNSHWGIDLGGTKIEGVVLDDQGRVLARQRLPTQREKGYDHILQRIASLVSQLSQTTQLQPTQVGIGTPGAIDPHSGLLKNSNTTVLNGRPLDHDLANLLGIPVRLANDANCFAIAETRLGSVAAALPEARVVFGVIMGTGVGGGLVIDNKVWTGRHAIAGEWGHTFLDESGGPCYCGQQGCVEMLISGPALERYYTGLSGHTLPLAEILTRQASDAAAAATIQRLLHFFGKGLANVINILDPDAIVLGGGLSQINLLYSEGVDQVRQHVFNPTLQTPILRPSLGDSAGVFGAAMLF